MSCSTSVRAIGQLHLGESRQDKPACDPGKMQILMMQTACERLSRCVSLHPSLIPKRFAHEMIPLHGVMSLCNLPEAVMLRWQHVDRAQAHHRYRLSPPRCPVRFAELYKRQDVYCWS